MLVMRFFILISEKSKHGRPGRNLGKRVQDCTSHREKGESPLTEKEGEVKGSRSGNSIDTIGERWSS